MFGCWLYVSATTSYVVADDVGGNKIFIFIFVGYFCFSDQVTFGHNKYKLATKHWSLGADILI